MARLQEFYKEKIVADLTEKFLQVGDGSSAIQDHPEHGFV
jgi:hypothetical protein